MTAYAAIPESTISIDRKMGNVRFGSLADLLPNTSLMSASGGKAVIL